MIFMAFCIQLPFNNNNINNDNKNAQQITVIRQTHQYKTLFSQIHVRKMSHDRVWIQPLAVFCREKCWALLSDFGCEQNRKLPSVREHMQIKSVSHSLDAEIEPECFAFFFFPQTGRDFNKCDSETLLVLVPTR